jgi:hypothetical protein
MANPSGSRLWAGLKRIWTALTCVAKFVVASLEPLSKLAQIVAVVIAGLWSYYIYQTTEEGEPNPQVSVSAEAFPYSKDARFVVVRIHQKNIGKIPIYLHSDSLSVRVKRVPEALKSGYEDMDKQESTYETSAVWARSGAGGIELSAGVELDDMAQFVVEPGLYHIEAYMKIPDYDYVTAFTVIRVQ